MTLYKRDGSPFWQMSIVVDGKRLQMSTKKRDKKLAMEIYHSVYAELAKRQLPGAPTGTDKTVRELLECYLEKRSKYKAPKTFLRDKSLMNHLLARLS